MNAVTELKLKTDVQTPVEPGAPATRATRRNDAVKRSPVSADKGGTFPLNGRVRLPDRLAELVTENSYGVVCRGTALDPEICDGDLVIATPERKPRAGDFVIFWPRGDGEPFVKRLVIPFIVDPGKVSPNSGVMPLAIVEQLNPPRQYEIGADRISAVHVVVGWLKPGEYTREPIRNAALVGGGAS